MTTYDRPHVTIDGDIADEPCILVMGHNTNAEPLLDAGYHGPFGDKHEAQMYARDLRKRHGIPGHTNIVPTPEENEAWTNAGWTFGIFALTRED